MSTEDFTPIDPSAMPAVNAQQVTREAIQPTRDNKRRHRHPLDIAKRQRHSRFRQCARHQ